jgi:hypothetical protein
MGLGRRPDGALLGNGRLFSVDFAGHELHLRRAIYRGKETTRITLDVYMHLRAGQEQKTAEGLEEAVFAPPKTEDAVHQNYLRCTALCTG